MFQPQRTIQETIDMHTDDYASMLASLKPAARNEWTIDDIRREHPEDIDWLVAHRNLDMAAFAGVTFARVIRSRSESVYISSENDVLELGRQVEPSMNIEDDAYAALIRTVAHS